MRWSIGFLALIFLGQLTFSQSQPSEATALLRIRVEHTGWDNQGRNYNVLIIDKSTIPTPYNGREFPCKPGTHTVEMVRWGSPLGGSGKCPLPVKVSLEAGECKEILIDFPQTIMGKVSISASPCPK